MVTEIARSYGSVQVLDRLRGLCSERGLDALAGRLSSLDALVGDDIRAIEADLDTIARRRNVIERSARHLLDLSGKRIRPLCVALASRVGCGFDGRVHDLAVAAELVHSATLLHDDVVDLAAERRGAPAARAVLGNAASIFAGDWLLIEALKRVERAAVPGVLVELLDTIAEMIHAESLQLDSRGRIDTSRELYFRIAEGKSATLFRWAMEAGGRAGGLDGSACSALRDFGLNLGVAFQVIDDLLDLTGDVLDTGKALFADLSEGKMTYPLIVALERDRTLRLALDEIVFAPVPPPEALCRRIVDGLQETGAAEECRRLASDRAAKAVRALAFLPAGEATTALGVVAESSVLRRH
jgi:octaprenyl-diphosphate synthase